MYVDPFWFGVASTVFVELVIVFVYAVIKSMKK